MLNTQKSTSIIIFASIFLLLASCLAPEKPAVPPVISQPASAAHARKISTPDYAGGGAVIFVLRGAYNSNSKAAMDQVILSFGGNNAPLNVALQPQSGGGLDRTVSELSYFSDAGIIDISTNGGSFNWLKFNSPSSGAEYDRLVAKLVSMRALIHQVFGTYSYACLMPADNINESNFRALQDSGYKVLCSTASDNLRPSIKPTSWSGTVEAGGLYRLPITGTISASLTSEQVSLLMSSAKQSIDNLGVAVIQIDGDALAEVSINKIAEFTTQLNSLIKACRQLGDITTLENWYSYICGCPPDAIGIQRPLPPYSGGPIIIFRLDDVSRGYYEDVVKAIIEMFKSNGIPLDCGVVSNVNGSESYQIPWLKTYVDQNVVGLSVHGYDWTFYQLDISKRYLTLLEDLACIDINAAKAEAEKAKVSYEELKFKLRQARCKYLKYFGILPVSFTVPTDYYDELGYMAVQDAGYKVFSAHRTVESCPSSTPVNYACHTDVNTGMYRIPNSYDLCEWHECKWDQVINIDKPMAQQGYCVYVDAFGESIEYNDFGITVCTDMNALGVTAISLHPACFVDKDGKPDILKLEKAGQIIRWFKSFATMMTFEQWYRYRTGDK